MTLPEGVLLTIDQRLSRFPPLYGVDRLRLAFNREYETIASLVDLQLIEPLLRIAMHPGQAQLIGGIVTRSASL